MLYRMDSLEKEDAFYSLKNGCLKKREGYYIYYAKETAVQTMDELQEKEEKENEPDGMKIDLTCENTPPKASYRAYLEEKAKKQITVPAYLMTAVLFAVIGVLGYSTITNYQKMSVMESTLKQMDNVQTMETENPETVQVETVAGNIQPTEENVAENTVPDTTTTEQADTAIPDTQVQENAQSTEIPTSDAPAEQAMTLAQQYLSQGYYIVEKGDSLVGICRKIYQTTAMMDKLCEVNGIENPDAIYEGQYLTLPN